MLKTSVSFIIIVAAALSLSSCQMRSPKLESWANPTFKGHTLEKTVVLAIAESEARCQQFEMIFVNNLLTYVPAGSLRESMKVTGKIEKEELESVLKQNQVKTLIVTTLLDGTSRDQLVTIGYDATPYTDGYYGYYDFGYTLQANTATVSSYMEYTLETNIYDVKSKKLVWSGRKSVFDDRSDTDNMEIIIKSVVRDLNDKGMLN